MKIYLFLFVLGIYVQASCHDEKISIAVRDSGKGLAMDPAVALAGNPQPSSGGGLGLGLSLTTRIIRLLGGEIHYSASPQPTFTISIEAVDEKDIAG